MQSWQACHSQRWPHFSACRMQRSGWQKDSFLVIISQKHDVTCTGFRSNIVSSTSGASWCIWSSSAAVRATSPNSYLQRKLFQAEVDYALPAETADIPVIHHKIGERVFSYAVAWNSLPTTLTNLTDTQTFKSSLETYLFKLAYNL